mmetsp:Transcript_11842/g.23063  ORF Transcript_11842/g.23063 Transcript_11842/m.23063 type:complete len:258 (-) Transcript_11842:63-836(-)
MLQNGILDLADVLRPDPVLGGAPQKTLTGILILLGALIVPKRAVHGRQPHHDVGVISPDPGLIVHPIDVELLAGVGGGVLIVLLEDFVKAHEVEVDVLFEGQKGFGDGVGLIADAVEDGFVGTVLGRGATGRVGDGGGVVEGGHLALERGNLIAELRDLLEGEFLDLDELGVDAGVEVLFGRGGVGGGELTAGRVGGRGGGEGHFAGGLVDAGQFLLAQITNDLLQFIIVHVRLRRIFRGTVLRESLSEFHHGGWKK